jgi:hypothetical protein
MITASNGSAESANANGSIRRIVDASSTDAGITIDAKLEKENAESPIHCSRD